MTYLLLVGSLPFKAKKNSDGDIVEQILNEPTPYPLSKWESITPIAKSFVEGLLNKDPYKRLTVKQALDHEWFSFMTKHC